MGDSNSELIKAIVHYQQCLEKYTKRNDESRMLYCIGKLYKMPITVEHLEQTGVGRTVNSLRKFNGEVGDAAKSLVSKWKEMVMVVGEENDAKEAPVKAENSKNYRDEDKKHKEKSSSSSSSSHKESDRKSKYDSKDKNSTSYSNGDESSSKKEDHRSKHKSHKKDKDKESKHHKHKSSKRKHSSDTSDSEGENYERTQSSSNHKHHKSFKQKTEDSEDENQQEMEKSRSDRYKSPSKRKYEDSDDEEYEQVKTKHRKYSENEESDDSEIEDKQEKPSHKHQSKHKEISHSSKDSKEKSKHHNKYKEKKDDSNEDKSRKHTDEKVKEKYANKEKVKSSSSSSEKREKEESSKKSKHSSKHHSKEHKSSKKSSTHSKDDVDEGGIGSGSGTSFAEALGMLLPTSSKSSSKKKPATVPSFPNERSIDNNASTSDIPKTEPYGLLKQKKLEPLDLNISSLLPEITPNYRPLGSNSLDNGHPKNKFSTEDETLSAIMYNKISRTKVYSGNKVIWGKVPTLFDLCTRILQDNIDALEYTGGVPYSILKPVIERANPDQLYMLEHHNPYLIEDTDELWQFHCKKEFRSKRREEMETWRDMYIRCLDEREAKLKALTANIKQSQDKSVPVRQTKLAYVDGHSIVKPPRSIARKQAKHGTGGVEKKPAVTPSARLSALATAGAAGQIAVPNPGARAASTTGNSSAAVKPKKAPLMQKTLAFMKNRLFRR